MWRLHHIVYPFFILRPFFFFIHYYVYFFFFFSSRRRHTRSLRDWSSDVCSSDLSEQSGNRHEPRIRSPGQPAQQHDTAGHGIERRDLSPAGKRSGLPAIPILESDRKSVV